MDSEHSIRDVVLLVLKAFGGSIRGKTMLQKRLYFVSVLLDVDLGFSPHYYGPYSAAVASAVSELRFLGYLNESSAGWGVDQRGFEVARYDFSLTDEGNAAADLKAHKFAELGSEIGRAVRLIQQAGDLNYMELSIAAKAYFAFKRLRKEATIAEISGLMPQFGWSVSSGEIQKAAVFLEKTKLIATCKEQSKAHDGGA